MGDFEKILVTAIVGIIAAFIGYQLRRAMEKYDARRAQEELYDLLDAFSEQLDTTGGGDYLSHVGVWYYAELAEILSDIAKKEHHALGGDATYLLMRLVGGLKWSAQSPDTAKGVYEIDEVIADACTVMLALAKRRHPNDPVLRKKMTSKWKGRRALMKRGVDFIVPVMPPRPETAKPKNQPD